jgi:hypothetical protein
MSKITDILTNEKFLKTCSITFLTIFVLLLGVFVVLSVFKQEEQEIQEVVVEEDNPQALMLLIEFEDTEGINNFVYEMNQRGIPGLLMVNAAYVEENCEFVKGLQKYDIEIAGVAPGEPFWDIPYEEQYETVKETKERIEACTGEDMRVIGSRYFAYDENTLKVADALDIPYVFARGTTGAKATIYKASEYDAKIFSVSNVESEKWGSGSLCDYSYWAREGDPNDFKDELFTAFEMYDKVSPVSHTYLGGALKRWNEPYMAMFDELDIDWVTLDEFGKVDVYSTYSEIPDNREVQYTTPHPEMPLEQEIGVDNPCAVVETSEETSESTEIEKDELVMFHNGSGPMCLDAIEFFEANDIEYTEYLTTDENFNDMLEEYKEEYGDTSEGVSETYGYYPMIFYKDKSFSGFNDEIGSAILSL